MTRQGSIDLPTRAAVDRRPSTISSSSVVPEAAMPWPHPRRLGPAPGWMDVACGLPFRVDEAALQKPRSRRSCRMARDGRSGCACSQQAKMRGQRQAAAGGARPSSLSPSGFLGRLLSGRAGLRACDTVTLTNTTATRHPVRPTARATRPAATRRAALRPACSVPSSMRGHGLGWQHPAATRPPEDHEPGGPRAGPRTTLA
jgi:hypothetical protein